MKMTMNIIELLELLACLISHLNWMGLIQAKPQ